MAGTVRLEQMYDFLCQREGDGASFTVEQLAEQSDYAESTVRTYLTKKLVGYLVWEIENGAYVCDGISHEYSMQEFLEYMSQTSRHVKMDSTDRLVESLLERGSDAFLLALESYNRPSLKNRVQAFCVLMVDAWGLLLKAEVVRCDGREAIFPDGDAGDAITVSEAADSVFGSDEEPVRANVSELVEVHNDAVHLLIPDLQGQLGELFQASVLNFRRRFEQVAGRGLAELSPGLLTLAVDRRGIKPEVVERKYGIRTAERVEEFLERFRRLRAEYSGDSRFAVSVEQEASPLVEPVTSA